MQFLLLLLCNEPSNTRGVLGLVLSLVLSGAVLLLQTWEL